MAYTKIDKSVLSLLCCSLCKSSLTVDRGRYTCKACGLSFPWRWIDVGEDQFEEILDFRIQRPEYILPEGYVAWSAEQNRYERAHEQRREKDSLERYTNEIEGVKEIYTEEYHLAGKILDVGGHQGRLRHFLDEKTVEYVSADPFIDVFRDMDKQPFLKQAYPSLEQPCNFLAAHAENLPFKNDSFDWIHMRSVVDHFADPYIAFLEAYRCCKPGGHLLVGLKITDNKPGKSISAGRWLPGLGKRADKGNQDHMFRLSLDELRDLFNRTHWDIIKEHWQKPPSNACIYICGQARDLSD